MSSHDDLKVILENELEKITNELKTIAVKTPDSDDWVALPVAEDLVTTDPNSEADAVEEWNQRRALLVQLEIRYRNIKRAIDKFDSGKYGICEISGAPIEIERLQANPAARTNLANMDRESELPL